MKLRIFPILLVLAASACSRTPPPNPGTPPGDGALVVTGVLTNEGVECRALRSRDGRLYTLAGDTGGFGTGDTVTVRGTRAEMSICQQGITINVQSIERAP